VPPILTQRLLTGKRETEQTGPGKEVATDITKYLVKLYNLHITTRLFQHNQVADEGLYWEQAPEQE